MVTPFVPRPDVAQWHVAEGIPRPARFDLRVSGPLAIIQIGGGFTTPSMSNCITRTGFLIYRTRKDPMAAQKYDKALDLTEQALGKLAKGDDQAADPSAAAGARGARQGALGTARQEIEAENRKP